MTVIYPSPIFGPVHSRRLGVSLGINLMPADGKVCTFDCIYCECGFNADHRPRLPRPTRQTLALRDKYFPRAKVSVLSNSTFIHKPEVFDALSRVDNNILKLDTVDEDYIRLVDRPTTGHYSVDSIVEGMKAFKGRCIIQTMFLKGGYLGRDVDNTSDRYVLPWLERVKEIAPQKVMIYTIDRETPDHDLLKATHEELDRIGRLVSEAGFEVSVSY